MPVALSPSPPDLSQPTIGKLNIDTKAPVQADGTVASAGVEGSARSPAGTVLVTPDEVGRQVKLGMLLVQLGVAEESRIFGPHGLITPPRDLLVINRQEDRKDALRPFCWYDPISWFLSGPRPSPMLWSPFQPSKADTTERFPLREMGTAVGTQTPSATSSAALAANSRHVPRRIRALPTVNMQSLPDSASLEPAVREDRDKLLKDEEHLHDTLNGFEKTRNTYLVPSHELQCEDEVNAVVKCYERYSVTAARAGKQGTSNYPVFPGNLSLPEAADVLKCGPVVSLLRRCAENVVTAYSGVDSVS